jgi:hypothetical protein
MPLKTRIRAIRTELQNRRAERLAHRRLSEELAAYQTPAERIELDEMLNRHSAEETRLIREILNRQDHERQRTMAGIGSSGYRA